LDSTLRQRLRELLQENPQLGIAPARGLERRIPRLPIALVRGVDDPGARRLVEALGRRGLQAAGDRGGAPPHPQMRVKVRSLTQRALAIAVTSFASTVGVWQHAWGLAAAAVGVMGLVVVMVAMSIRNVTRPIRSRDAKLPPRLRGAIDRLEHA